MVYLLSEVKVIDEPSAEMYKKLASLSIEKFSGKYIVRGADPISLEGKTGDRKIVMVEFPSESQLKEWYNPEEYKEALQYQDKALVRDLCFVKGLDQ
jgi:uncharacterized protein (DUF1330 family)